MLSSLMSWAASHPVGKFDLAPLLGTIASSSCLHEFYSILRSDPWCKFPTSLLEAVGTPSRSYL